MRISIVLAIACALSAACSEDGSRAGSRDSATAAGVVVSPAEFATAAKYLGIRYDSLPPTFSFVSGGLISAVPGSSAMAFDLDLVRTPRGQMVWLDSIVTVSTRGRPSRIVRAELKVPPLAADERLVLSSCDVDGRLDPRVVAIVVVDQNAPQNTSIRQAWRANAASGQFEVIPVTGITCEKPGS